MPKTTTRKVGLAMRVELYEDLSKLAKDNGQSSSFILEKAVEHYTQLLFRIEFAGFEKSH